MEEALTAVAVLALLFLSAARMVVWSRKAGNRLRGSSIILALLATMLSAVTIGSVLGHAVPLVGGLTAPSGEQPVLSAKLIVGKGIYLTLDLPDEPKLYWLPWNRDLAEQLQKMLEEGGGFVVVPPFEWSWDQTPSLQPLPQPKWMPDKPPEPERAPRFSV